MRRDDAAWRRQVTELRGSWCAVCGVGWPLECDHLIPRAQRGPSVVANGWMLCRDHHRDKTDHRLKIDPRWLGTDQIEWLERMGYAWWTDTGEVYGLHRRLFVDVAPDVAASLRA